MTEAANGFLGRWARRKNDALLGKPLAEPDQPVPLVTVAPVDLPVLPTHGEATAPAPNNEPLPALSLDDVKLLTKDSDFKPFMAKTVGPDVRNAAMKKLFEDPHFNVMDGLDIYIDDYSISEPIPESMLRQMVSAKFLNLFEEDKENASGPQQGPPDAPALTSQNSDAVVSHDVPTSFSTEPVPPLLDSMAAGVDPSSQPEVHSAAVASQENHADSHL
ncbi:MAG: DUF3306 domain-containing protein [Polaromonas sp.]|nr:DUF3306 domain-containing protein [Polaromonas sp.]